MSVPFLSSRNKQASKKEIPRQQAIVSTGVQAGASKSVFTQPV
jgi:hypothetical protein